MLFDILKLEKKNPNIGNLAYWQLYQFAQYAKLRFVYTHFVVYMTNFKI